MLGVSHTDQRADVSLATTYKCRLTTGLPSDEDCDAEIEECGVENIAKVDLRQPLYFAETFSQNPTCVTHAPSHDSSLCVQSRNASLSFRRAERRSAR